MKRWIVGGVILLAALCGSRSGGAESNSPVIFCGAVLADGRLDAGMTDLLLVELSKVKGVRVVDRAAMRLIVDEQSLQAIQADSSRQSQLGRLLGVRYFVWVDTVGRGAVVDVVEADTGRGLASLTLSLEANPLAEQLGGLATQVVAVARQGLPAPGTNSIRVAFSPPQFTTTNDAIRMETEDFLGRLGAVLRKSGVEVLTRRAMAAMIDERWRVEKGWAQAGAASNAWANADYVIRLAGLDLAQPVEVSMVETRTGRRLGTLRKPMAAWKSTSEIDKLRDWLTEHMTASASQTNNTAAANNRVALEALNIFYNGIRAHNLGRYLNALDFFTEAQIRGVAMGLTECWVNQCYRQSGFADIAKEREARQGIAHVFTNKECLSNQLPLGIVFLGVTTDPGRPLALKRALEFQVDAALYKYADLPVVVIDDLAQMRDEYDVLVGLSHVRGTQWHWAPSLMLYDMLSAHCETADGAAILRLCRISHYDPGTLQDVRVALTDTGLPEPSALAGALRELLGGSGHSWTPPPLIFDETLADLEQRLKASPRPNPWAYWIRPDILKLLHLDPLRTDACSFSAERFALQRWCLSRAPADHPARMYLAFSLAGESVHSFRSFGSPAATNRVPLYRVDPYRELARTYPQHPIGLFSLYNAALGEMTPTNYAAIQAELEEILERLEPMHAGPGAVGTISNMNAALKYALGKSGGHPFDGMSSCYPILEDAGFPPPGTIIDSHASDAFLGPPCGDRCYTDGQPVRAVRSGIEIFTIPYCTLNTPDRMRLEFDMICRLHHNGAVTFADLRSFIEALGPDSPDAKAAALRYVKPASRSHGIKNQSTAEDPDLCIVFPVIVNALKEIMAMDPPGMDVNTMLSLSRTFWYTLPKIPVLTNALMDLRITAAKTYPGPDWLDAAMSPGHRIKWVSTSSSWEQFWSGDPRTNLANFSISSDLNYMAFVNVLDRLHRTFDNEPKTIQVVRLYITFAIQFYRTEHYDLAEPLLAQIVGWYDGTGEPVDLQAHVTAAYLLATLQLRNGNYPKALELAKGAMALIERNPKLSLNIQNSHYNLKSLLVALIDSLRQNEKPVFTKLDRDLYR